MLTNICVFLAVLALVFLSSFSVSVKLGINYLHQNTIREVAEVPLAPVFGVYLENYNDDVEYTQVESETYSEADMYAIDILRSIDENSDYLWEAYNWVKTKINYRGADIDFSGEDESKIADELSLYSFLTGKGSCEHQAAVLYKFMELLGYDDIRFVYGERYSVASQRWGPHYWILAMIDGTYYHFDPLYERTYPYAKERDFYKKTDIDIADTHKWDREYYPKSP